MPLIVRTQRQSSLNFLTNGTQRQESGQQQEKQFQVPSYTDDARLAAVNPVVAELALGNTKFSLNMFKV